MNQNQSAYGSNNKTEPKSPCAQSREITEGLSWQPLMQLLRMNHWFLNTSGNVLLPLDSFWDKLAGILDAFEVSFFFELYHEGGRVLKIG